MKRNILCVLVLCLSGVFSWGAGKKNFIGIGPDGKTIFKNEITIFEAKGDPKPRCPECHNFRVIVDVVGDAPMGDALPSFVVFDTTEACGEDADDSPMAELTPMYQAKGSPSMTTSHPLLLVMNPTLCNGKSVKLKILHKACMNWSKPECQELVPFSEPFEILAADLLKGMPDVDLDSSDKSPFPNMKKGKKLRVPANTKPAKK